MMKSYSATVKVRKGTGSNTTLIKTQVQAANPSQAKWLLETQYGAGNVISSPQQTK